MRLARQLGRLIAALSILAGSTVLLAAPAGADQTGPPDAAGNYMYCDVSSWTYGVEGQFTGATAWTKDYKLACNYGLLNGVTDTLQGTPAGGTVMSLLFSYTPTGGSLSSTNQNLSYSTSTTNSQGCDKTGAGSHQLVCWVSLQGFGNGSTEVGSAQTMTLTTGTFIYSSSNTTQRQIGLYYTGNTSHLGTNWNSAVGSKGQATPAFPAEHWSFGDFGAGVTTSSGAQSTAGTLITSVSADFDTTATVAGHTGHLRIEYNGSCTLITVNRGDSTSATFVPSSSPVVISISWATVGGPYSATVACQSGNTWALSITVVASSSGGLSTCFDSGFGLLNPINIVKGMGCTITVLFEPSSTTTSQIGSIGSSLTSKAPFSVITGAATFLPDAAQAIDDGVNHQTNILGDPYRCVGVLGGGGGHGTVTPLSGVPGLGTVTGNDCDTSTIAAHSSAVGTDLLRNIFLAVIMIGFALGIWRTTVRLIG